MKKPTLTIFNLLIFCAVVIGAEDPDLKINKWDARFHCLSEADMQIKGNSLLISHSNDETVVVEITPEGLLFVNGGQIETSSREKKLLKTYNHHMRHVVREAKDLGKAAADVGLEGAKVSLEAIGEILEELCSEGDWEKLEANLEKKARHVEKRAQRLENQADDLEEVAEELEELHLELKSQIPELNRLRWF